MNEKEFQHEIKHFEEIVRMCREIQEEVELLKRKSKPHLRLDPQVAERLK